MALSASFSNTMAPGFRDIIGTTLNRWPAQYSQYCKVETSKRQYEDYLHSTGLPMAIARGEGKPTPFYDPLEGSTKRFTHEEFAMGFQVSTEAFGDDMYKNMSALRAAAGQLGEVMAERVEVDAADVFNSGFSSYGTIDGASAFFSASHPKLDGSGNQSNLAGTASVISETSVRAGAIQMHKWTNDRGILQHHEPYRGWVSVDYQYTGNVLMQTDRNPGGSNAMWDKNQVPGILPGGLKVNPYLTFGSAAWFLQSLKHSLMFLWRERPNMASWDDKNTRTAKFAMYMRYSVGPVWFVGWYGNAGT